MARKKGSTDLIINQVNVRPVNRRNIDIQKWRLAIQSAESLSFNRKQLYDIYAEILLDAHLRSITEKRVNAICNLQLRFFDEQNKEVDEIEMLIETSFFEQLLQEIVKAKIYGFTLLELDWQVSPDYKNKTYSIPREHVKPELGIVVANSGDTTGFDYTEHPFVIFAGSKTDLGLLNQASPLVIYKRNNVSDWADYNELFGKPYPQGSYSNDDTADLLTQAFEKAGFDAYMVAPEDAKITLHTSGSGSSNDNFKSLREAMNEELSILILGQNLTTKVSGDGSYAATSAHGEVEESIHTTDREFTLKVLNEQLIPILNNIGYKANGHFDFVYTDDISIDKRIDIDTKVAGLVPIDDSYFYETYGIPAPTQKKAVEKQDKTEKVNNPKLEHTNKLSILNLFKSFFQQRAVLKF
jgi:phage gp29-like protein